MPIVLQVFSRKPKYWREMKIHIRRALVALEHCNKCLLEQRVVLEKRRRHKSDVIAALLQTCSL